MARRKNLGAKTRTKSPAEIPKGIEASIVEKSSGGISVRDLVKELGADYGADRIVARVIELEEKGTVSVVEPSPYRSFVSFLVSPLSLWFWGALAAAVASLVLVYVSSGVILYLRYVFGGLLVLFLPGYSLVEALYAKKQELEGLTRIALSIGLSLALVPLTGLVLNYTPWGIRLLPVTISLVLLTAVFLLLAAQRKYAYYRVAKRLP